MNDFELRTKLMALSMKDLARYIVGMQTSIELIKSGATQSENLEELISVSQECDECLPLAIEIFCQRTRRPKIKPENTNKLEEKLWSLLPRKEKRKLRLTIAEPEVLDAVNIKTESFELD